MENFFEDDKFYSDFSDFLDDHEIDEDNYNELPEDVIWKMEESTLEPIFELDADKLSEMLFDTFDDRTGEDFDDNDHNAIMKAIKESVDFEKLKELMPKYYYPNGKYFNITKQDIIEHLKNNS